MFLSKYGVARHIGIPIVKRGVVDFSVGADWTPAAGDVKISKDLGAAANVTNLPVAIVMGNGAIWDFSLTATEMQAAQIVVTVADATTKAVEDQSFIIETYGNASAQHVLDLSVNQTGDSFARLGAPAGASHAADVAAVKGVLPAALVGGRIDASVGAMAANTMTAAAAAADLTTELQTGLATASALATVQADTDDIQVQLTLVKAKTDNLPASPAAVGSAMALTSGERDAVADALLDRADAIETGITLRQAIRGKVAMLFGVLTGAQTGAETFKNPAGDTTRIVVADDSSGNRSSVTLNL